MTATVASFRAALPKFADAAAYPDASVQFWLSLAQSSLPPSVWGSRLDYAVTLYAAHFLTINSPKTVGQGAQARQAFDDGLAKGLVSSKSVSGVSKSMDLSVGQTEGGGSFNLTLYGQQYLTLLDSVGVGVVQL